MEKDEVLLRYLLGQLSEAEQERIEKSYFNDDGFYEQLEIVEDDLVDAYVRGTLAGSTRERFEKYYLSYPDRQEKVAFAREWKSLVSAPTAKRRKPFSWADVFKNRLVLVPLVASVLLVIGTIWLGLQMVRLNEELQRVNAERTAQEKEERELRKLIENERVRNEDLSAELENERAKRDAQNPPATPQSLPIIASFILNPGLSREAGDARRFPVPAEATEVRLQAIFNVGNYQTFVAELQTVEGRTIWSRRGLRASSRGTNRVAVVTLPARILNNDDYILVLRGVTPGGDLNDVAEYSFRIVR
jgi:hypothetical protein